MAEIRHKRITTPAGITIAADIAGPADGPGVILLHGGGQTRHSWSGELERLAGEGYYVVSYDARGHGESEWAPDGVYTMEALAEDLKAIITATHMRRPLALVGASMGGITSLVAIGTTVDAIADALVMVDITPRPAQKGADRIIAFMNAHHDGFATIEDAVDAVAAYNPERPRPPSPHGLMKNLRLRDDGRLYWHWDPKLVAPQAAAEPPRLAQWAIEAAHNVKVPTLLVRGGKSDVVDDESVRDMQALIPQTELFDVKSAGHMVAGDDNSNFHAGIIGFLHRHVPAEG